MSSSKPEGEGIDAARDLLLHSHLAPTGGEDGFIEFEFALHHIAESFGRWAVALHEFVGGEPLPAQDISVLQTIRMNERAKSAVEIGKFLNRDDSSNILYTLRKLDKAGLIRKSGGPSRQTTYQVTDHGRAVTDRYAEVRKQVLLPTVERLGEGGGDLGAVTRTMWQISGLYEQAARTVSMMQMLQPEAERPVAAPAKGRKAKAAA